MSRSVIRYVAEFRFLQNVVVKHIPHPFSMAASQKSDTVCEKLHGYLLLGTFIW